MTKGRVLIVEDEPLIGLMIEDFLSELGYSCVGNCTTLACAETQAKTLAIDAVFVDIRIKGESAYPLCELLDGLNIPFGFISAIPRKAIHPLWQYKPYCGKPFDQDDIVELLSAIMTERNQAVLFQAESMQVKQ